MSEILLAPLSHFADVVMGQSPGADLCNTEGLGLPFLQGCAEFGVRHPQSEIYCSPPLRVAKAGSVLISVRAPVGTMNYADQDYCIGRGLGAFKAKASVSNTIFLKHAVELNVAYLHRRSQGSTFAAVSTDDVKTVPIPVFTPEKQAKIAAILSCIDATIGKTEALIAKYQQIKAGMMHDLFSRGVLPSGQLRPTLQQAPELYQETVIGWIPKEWGIVAIERLCSDVVDCPHSTPLYEMDGVPCIRTADMIPGELLLEQAYRVSEKAYWNRVSRLVPKSGDIIYSREGERLGIASPVGSDAVCLGQRVMLLRPFDRGAAQFLMWAMNMPSFYRQVIKGLGATTSPHVNVGDVKKILVPNPSAAEQYRIGELIEKVHQQVATEKDSLEKLYRKKRGLAQDLLSGAVAIRLSNTAQGLTNG